MAFLTTLERYYALILIVDLAMKMGYMPNYSFYFIFIFTPYVGYGLYEGEIRIQILIGYLVYVVNFFIIYLSGDNYIMSWVTAIIGSFVAFITVHFGSVNYLNPDGPYGVGHRVVIAEGETKPTISIFYPIDRAAHDKHIRNSDRTSSFYLEGDKDVTGFAKAMGGVPEFLFKPFKSYMLKAINDEKLDIDFTEGDKKLTPVILSHSLKCNRNALVSIIYYLVSYGCIVYAPTHTDESANYFKDYTSDPPKDVFFHGYDKEKDGPNKHEFYLKQLKHRMIDIKIILDLIISESKSTIPAIDLSKLTALGHSLGGITAIEACNQFSSHFKLCIALDPLFSPRFKQIKEIGDYRIDQPIILINSEDFHNSLVHQEYNSKEIHDKFVKCQKEYSKNKVYNVYIKNCYHINQCDYSLVNTHLLMFMGQLPKSVDPKDKYKECIDVILAFMDENNFVPINCDRQVKNHVTIEE